MLTCCQVAWLILAGLGWQAGLQALGHFHPDVQVDRWQPAEVQSLWVARAAQWEPTGSLRSHWELRKDCS